MRKGLSLHFTILKDVSNKHARIQLSTVLLLLVLCGLILSFLYTNGINLDNFRHTLEAPTITLKDKVSVMLKQAKLDLTTSTSTTFEADFSSQTKPTPNLFYRTNLTSRTPTKKAKLLTMLKKMINNGIKFHKRNDSTTFPSKKTFSLLKNLLMEEIKKNNPIPLLTLFTTWIDASDKHLVHNLTARNWMSFVPLVIPVIFTNDSAIADSCRHHGWKVLPVRVTAACGVPVLKFMFEVVMSTFNTTFYAYSNGDILYTDGLINTLLAIKNSDIDIQKPVLLTGKRTNVENVTKEEDSSWESLSVTARQRGELFTGWAEDYFITPRNYPWNKMAEVVIGRTEYDNWLVYYARKLKYDIIDCTQTLLAVHQTTIKGNFEGHTHPNAWYNHNMVIELDKRFKFEFGSVDCVDHHTKYKNESIVIGIRTIPDFCSI